MKRSVNMFSMIAVAGLLFSQSVAYSQQAGATYVELKRENFQKEIDGKQVDLFTIKNKNGMVVNITNYGAKVEQILVPDKNGALGRGARL